MPNKYEMFFYLLDRIITPAPESTSSWQERKAEILANATEHDKTNLLEFISWFDEEDFL